MALERDLWKLTKDNAPVAKSRVDRVEDRLGCGIPDVNYCINGKEGHIELKKLDAFPVLPTTTVKLKHFTKEQRNWHRDQHTAGGTSWLWIRVGSDEFFLFPGHVAADKIGVWTAAQWRSAAFATGGYWKGRVNWVAFWTKVTGLYPRVIKEDMSSDE